MSARSPWQAKVDAYVAERRGAGFKLSIAARQLASFARFAQSNAPRSSLTLELASRWALASRHGARLTAARRIEVLRSTVDSSIRQHRFRRGSCLGLRIVGWPRTSIPTLRSVHCSMPRPSCPLEVGCGLSVAPRCSG